MIIGLIIVGGLLVIEIWACIADLTALEKQIQANAKKLKNGV